MLVGFACEDKEQEKIYGCTDPAACNFNSDATIYVPNSCMYACDYDGLVIMDACADAFITAEPESTPCAANKVLSQSLEKRRIVPIVYALSPPYPNPSTSFTNIYYALPEESEVIISILNNSGGNIVQLLNTPQTAGYKTVSWNLNDDSDQRLESGIYTLRLSAGDYMAEKELQIIDYSINEDAETYAK